MTEVTKLRAARLALSFLVLSTFVSCGGLHKTTDASRGPSSDNPKAAEAETTEVKLRRTLASPQMVVVRDVKDTYWAISALGIQEIGSTGAEGVAKVALKPGARVAAGSGHGDPTQIAELLMEQMGPRGGPYFVAFRNKDQPNEVSVSGQAGEAKGDVSIEVKELVLSRAQQ
jgi:hypothetical protein